VKKYLPTIITFTIVIGVIALGIWYSDKNSPIKELAKLNIYSKEELSFLEKEGFLDNIDSENLPGNKEQIISLLKSPGLIEQNLNAPDESFEVLATKLDKDNYQLAFKLENRSNQSKEFYLISISESSQTEFKEIKGVVKDGKVNWGNQGDWGYDIEKHKQELMPELAQAYDDIDNNGYTGKPIKLVLEANSTLLAQSKWQIDRERVSDSLEPIYLLVYGSAGGAKDELNNPGDENKEYIYQNKVTSECSSEVCWINDEDKKECTVTFGKCQRINDKGTWKDFTDVVGMSFDNNSGNLIYSYKDDYSITSRLIFVMDFSKEECNSKEWDWRNKDNLCFLMPDKAKEFMEANNIINDIIITKNPGYYKYAMNITGIPLDYQNNLAYVGLYLEKGNGLTWDDVEEKNKGKNKEKGKEKSLIVKDKIKLNFNDLEESGFTLQFYDKRTILIGNVKNKENLYLDPVTEPTGETSDGYIRGEDSYYATARSTSSGFSISANILALGQKYYDSNCAGTATPCGEITTSDCENQDGCLWYMYQCYISPGATSCDSFDDNESGCGATSGDPQYGCSWEDEEYWVYRGYLDFDTSSIPDDASVTDVLLSLKVDTDVSYTDFDVQIYKYDWAEPITSDNREVNYDASGAVYDADWKNTSEISSGNSYDSSSLDNSWINLTGDTKYQLRSSRDVNEDEPYENEYIYFYSADSEGNEPILKVTYTIVTIPSVTTNAATSVEATTATGNGNITAIGGENCDIRGIVWDLATHGDPGNVAPGASSYANDVAENGDFGTGAFTRSLTSLPTSDTIYARAYAHNSAGYAYGAEINFLTKPAAPTNVAATDGAHTDKVTITWTKSTGATGYKVYEGINLLDTLGDVATYDDTAAAEPTITAGTAIASNGTSTAHVALSLSGQSANDGASRTYKVRATNATGDSADSNTNAGYRGPGSLTYQWQRSAADSDADYSNIDGATTASYNDTGAPADGSGRYYKCVENAIGADQQISSVDRGYRDTEANTTPTISSVSDYPDPRETGNDITFSVDWNDDDGEGIKMLICKTSNFTPGASPSCDDGQWCSNDDNYDSTDPITCLYTTQAEDINGSKNYYAFVCDNEPSCSDYTSGTFTVKAVGTPSMIIK